MTTPNAINEGDRVRITPISRTVTVADLDAAADRTLNPLLRALADSVAGRHPYAPAAGTDDDGQAVDPAQPNGHWYGKYEQIQRWCPGPPSQVYLEVQAEADRAHRLHGVTSMRNYGPTAPARLAILTEEIGEVAKEFNEARHEDRPVDLPALRKELIQVAAMAADWASTLSGGS